MIEFTPYQKTPRLFKDPMVITEKIDGTNAAIGVVELQGEDCFAPFAGCFAIVETGDTMYGVYAQSRNRLIQPVSETGQQGSDNYGFAAWVLENAEMLARVLGPGLHFGEWWGQGIARNYGLTGRRFSLFNTSRWKHLSEPEARLSLGVPRELSVVPVLGIHTLDTEIVRQELWVLEQKGSVAAPGFMDPEGVCVFLPGAGTTFKVTCEDDRPKWWCLAGAREAV